MPQIEVAFDIDANGIVDVSAKDMATGKQQSIRITASSGLTQEEIDRLIRDAELHAQADSNKKDLVDARNTADALVYTTEKSLTEIGDKIDEGIRTEVENAVKNLRRVMDGEDASEIRRLTEVLTEVSHKMASAVYQDTHGSGEPQHAYHAGNAKETPSSGSDDDVVDAEYQEVA
jgi:molecular chaperone DnaK